MLNGASGNCPKAGLVAQLLEQRLKHVYETVDTRLKGSHERRATEAVGSNVARACDKQGEKWIC